MGRDGVWDNSTGRIFSSTWSSIFEPQFQGPSLNDLIGALAAQNLNVTSLDLNSSRAWEYSDQPDQAADALGFIASSGYDPGGLDGDGSPRLAPRAQDAVPLPPSRFQSNEPSRATFDSDTTRIDLQTGNVELVWTATEGRASIQGQFNEFLDGVEGASLTVDYAWALGSVVASVQDGYGLVFDADGDVIGFDTYGTGWLNLTGGQGNDRLEGSLSSINRLEGGHGDDILFGSHGDALLGGPGRDTFILRAQEDSHIRIAIEDFELQEDTILLDFSGLLSAQALSESQLSSASNVDDFDFETNWISGSGTLEIISPEFVFVEVYIPGLIGTDQDTISNAVFVFGFNNAPT